jgi:hypothetical protein
MLACYTLPIVGKRSNKGAELNLRYDHYLPIIIIIRITTTTITRVIISKNLTLKSCEIWRHKHSSRHSCSRSLTLSSMQNLDTISRREFVCYYLLHRRQIPPDKVYVRILITNHNAWRHNSRMIVLQCRTYAYNPPRIRNRKEGRV